jgi:hypothetical protein
MRIMSKVKVLFFAADPLSASPDGRTPRLLLDEDVRQIHQKVRAAEHRDALEFDVRWAARTDDLLQALNETRPQVVHFSGHGGSDGLVLVGSEGRGAHYVDAAALAQLFQVFRGEIRVAVLSACFSLPQAEAIAGAVGCAIGTRGEISDSAAITFAASFYRAIAFGHSVQDAYDQARVALRLEHFEDREWPQLVVRPGVDPARLVLIQADGVEARGRGPGRTGMTVAGLALAGAAVVASVILGDRSSGAQGPQLPDSTQVQTAREGADTLPVADSTPAPGPARELVRHSDNRRTQPDDRHTQPVVPTQPVNVDGHTVEPMESALGGPPVRKLEGPSDSPAWLRDTARNHTLPPTFPR